MFGVGKQDIVAVFAMPDGPPPRPAPRPLVSWQTALHYTANHTEFVCIGQRPSRVRFMCSWCHDVTLIIDRNA